MSTQVPLESQKSWREWLSQWKFANTLLLPNLWLDRPFDPTDADRAAAWDLYNELRTRIVSQPLHYLSGNEKTALKSVATLFQFTRDLLHRHGIESRRFAVLSVFVLNRVVRPFTAKWHKVETDCTLSNEDVRHTFRDELNLLQEKLGEIVAMLGTLAESNDFVPGTECPQPPPNPRPCNKLPIPFAIRFDDHVCREQKIDQENLTCKGMQDLEEEEIRQRRAALAVQAAQAGAAPIPVTDVMGLAISGGGLRSATFALGALQVFAEKGMLRQFDYLSTVSGGGYVGSFLSSYLNSPSDASGDALENMFHKPAVGESPALRHLRAHSKFLLTGGLFGRFVMVLHAVYGLLANVVIILAWMTTALLIVALLDHAGVFLKTSGIGAFAKDTSQSFRDSCAPVSWRVVGIGWAIVAVLLAMMPLILLLSQMQSRSYLIKLYQRLTVVVTGIVAAATFFLCLPVLFRWHHDLLTQAISWKWNWSWLAGLALLQRIGTALTWIKKPNRAVRLITQLLLAVSGPLFILFLFLTVGQYFLVRPDSPDWRTLAFIAGLLLIYSHGLLDINQSSLHPFYRDRLSEAYLVRPPRAAGDPVECVARQPLSLLRSLGNTAPYHLLNGTINAPSGKHPSLRGRKSDVFVFSRHYCGSSATGFFPTKEIEKCNRNLDLATAMAISGAAAAPYMGSQKNPASMLFAMLNVRLDYWLRLPKRWCIPILGWFPGPWYLLRQVLGLVNERTTFVNLSDGGHLENLGLYELLRRQCKYVVAIDGECDPDITCGSLVNLQRMVRTDFGTEIHLDLTRVKKSTEGIVPYHFLLATIDYTPDVKEQNKKMIGYLLYLKSSLTGNESPPIARYRADNPEFSHESTADLFYDEAQFEAYRSLGHHIAMEVFRRELIGETPPETIAEWFDRLLERLLELPVESRLE